MTDTKTEIPGEALLEVLDAKGRRVRISMKLEGEEPRELLFRKPTDADWYLLVGGLPSAMQSSQEGRPIVKFDEQNPKHFAEIMRFADATVKRCAIAPKWIDESPAELPQNGPIPIEEIPAAVRIHLSNTLLDLSGLYARAEELGKS